MTLTSVNFYYPMFRFTSMEKRDNFDGIFFITVVHEYLD